MKRIRIILLPAIVAMLSVGGCGKADMDAMSRETTVILDGLGLSVKSSDPDETLISDVNIFVFNKEGLLEEHFFTDREGMLTVGGKPAFKVTLSKNMGYSLFVCANLRFRLDGISTIQDLENYRYYLTYPDEYSRGMPMSGELRAISDLGNGVLKVPVKRMMSKITVQIDRTRLETGTSIIVRSVEVGNCPKSASLFGQSRSLGHNDTFAKGFIKTGSQTDALNRDISPGISGSISLYMLENMQGDLLEDVFEDENKVLEHSAALAGVCSYIEIKAEYQSPDFRNKAGEYLVYRFYLGESRVNFDVERNCHYTFTIVPEKNGLIEDSWRVDKSGLERY